MTGRFFKDLTEASHHYIDWSRTGELIASGNHHYTQEQVFTRVAMGAFALASGLIGAYFNQPEKTGYASLTMGLLSGLAGLAVAHVPIVYPLFMKRWDVSQECSELTSDMKDKLNQHREWPPAQHQTLLNLMNKINGISLSNDEHGYASLTWGHRKRLLLNLNKIIEERGSDSAYWQQDTAILMSDVEKDPASALALRR